jgi:hypothetical protein
MTRPIKFRAWDGKKIVPVYSVEFESGAYGTGPTGERYDTLMQFTGLLDKNGKEIYEGDVVVGRGRPCEVEYDGGGFTPFAIPAWECTLEPSEVEVIGNIYENPNLI